MSKSIACMIGLVVVFSLGGCPQQQLDSGRDTPGAVAGPVVVKTAGFSVTLPDSAEPVDAGLDIPGASFQAVHMDAPGNLYMIYTIALESITQFSGDESNNSVRFDGMGLTSSGDFILLAAKRGQYVDVTIAMAELADGQWLYVGTDTSNPAKAVVFGSINLVNTDGTSIEDNAKDGVPLLIAPVKRGFVLLDDNFAYRVTGSTGLRQIAAWATGDSIVAHDATDFFPSSFTEQLFLTKMGEWESVEAEYVGAFSQSTVESVTELEFGSVEVVLADGSAWGVSYADESQAKSWQAGEAVAAIEDSGSFLGYTMLRLSTGQTLVVEPN